VSYYPILTLWQVELLQIGNARGDELRRQMRDARVDAYDVFRHGIERSDAGRYDSRLWRSCVPLSQTIAPTSGREISPMGAPGSTCQRSSSSRGWVFVVNGQCFAIESGHI